MRMAILGAYLLSELFCILSSSIMIADIISIWHPKWLVPSGYILLFVCIPMLARFVWRRELRRDIV